MKAPEKHPQKKEEEALPLSFNSMKELSDSKYHELNTKLRKALKPKTAHV
jgi:hypothetical protein